MPELPEVERTRLSLLPHVLGRTVTAVYLGPHPVVVGPSTATDLLCGRPIEAISRLGKELAIHAAGAGSAVAVHLGMTGSLRWRAGGPLPGKEPADRHVHVIWQLDDGSYMFFRDPRRFGGVWVFADRQSLAAARWEHLAADALQITPLELHERLQRTSRPLKAALLDQQVVAGLGNIYVDELLFLRKLHPLTKASRVDLPTVQALVPAMRRLLAKAIARGGSTLRDYVDGQGQAGSYQLLHQVYGRAGEPCRGCQSELAHLRVAGRMTVYCPNCQGRRSLPISKKKKNKS